MYKELLKRMLVVDEGLKLKPYVCPAGYLTIGVGRNLEDFGISEEEALFLLENDINRSIKDCLNVFGNQFFEIDPIRQSVLIDMMFNLGLPRFKTFKKMIEAVNDKDYKKASEEMLDSLWAKQVKDRAERLAYMMRTGEVHSEYK